MLKYFSSIGAALGLLFASGASAEPGSASLPHPDVTVFEAAKVITMEPGYPEARYVATADGIILGLGQTLDELEAWTRDRKVTVDSRFARQILMPGFIAKAGASRPSSAIWGMSSWRTGRASRWRPS